MSESDEFFKFLDVANDICKEKGQVYEFECPICKSKAKALKSTINGHLSASCKECDLYKQE